MRIEPGECQAGEKRGAKAGPGRFIQNQGCVGLERGTQAAKTIPEQKSCTAVAHGRVKPWQEFGHLPEAADAKRDQDGVRQGTSEADSEDMLAPQALPRYKCILRTDRNYEAETHAQPREIYREIHYRHLHQRTWCYVQRRR